MGCAIINGINHKGRAARSAPGRPRFSATTWFRMVQAARNVSPQEAYPTLAPAPPASGNRMLGIDFAQPDWCFAGADSQPSAQQPRRTHAEDDRTKSRPPLRPAPEGHEWLRHVHWPGGIALLERVPEEKLSR